MSLPPLPESIAGFRPNARLAWVLDVHAPKIEALRECMPQIKADGIVGAWVKFAEGEAPRTSRDKRIARATIEGAVEICTLLAKHDLRWGGYAYCTDGRDGSREHWDADDEQSHTVEQYHALSARVPAPPAFAMMLDAEDGKTDMEAAARAAWLMWHVVSTRAEIRHDVGVYLNAHWVKEHLLEQGDPIKRHYLEQVAPVLWQPHYGRVNRAPRKTEEIARGPGVIVPGWRHRAAWQITSKYLDTFDLNVVDLDLVELPGVCR